MKKGNPAKVFLQGFLKSFLFLAVLAAVGFTSYKITYAVYDSGKLVYDGAESVLFEKEGNKEHQVICQNLIYGVDAKTGKIKDMVLEIFNTEKKQITYLTIPEETEFSISNELYQKLCVINSEAPQIIQFRNLTRYFEGTSSYEYGEFLLDDLLNTDVSFYTTMSYRQFHRIFRKNENGTYIFRKAMWNRLDQMTDEKDRKEYMTKIYSRCSTNCNLASRLSYLSDYEGLTRDSLIFCSVEKTLEGEEYQIDIEKTNQLLSDIKNGQPPNTEVLGAPKAGAGGEVSEDMPGKENIKLEILNGSGKAGLAASYQERLQTDGYQVISIGNYETNTETVTVIHTREEQTGEELKDYFNNPEIRVEELPETIDAQIVVGSMDALQ